MQPNSQLTEYIYSQLAAGRRINDVVAELRNIGWNDYQIQMSMAQIMQVPQPMNYPQPNVSAAPSQQLNSAPKNNRKKVFGLIIAIIATTVTIFLLWLILFSGNNNGGGEAATAAKEDSTFVKFEDPNFDMWVPESWSGDAGYSPGSAIVLYYSPEDSSTNIERAASLTVYIDSHDDRIEQQLEYLGGNYELLSDEKYSRDGVKYRYTELISWAKATPNRRMYLATITASKEETIINADIIALEKYSSLHQEDAEKILKSITPK